MLVKMVYTQANGKYVKSPNELPGKMSGLSLFKRWTHNTKGEEEEEEEEAKNTHRWDK
jgi:hypothetical protein